MWFLYFRRLILIFLALTPSGIHSKCCLLHLHLISHWKVHRSDVFQHLYSSIFFFNEEFREATFGVLAKSVLSDSDQSSFTKLRFSFQTQLFISAVTTATCGKHDTTTTTHSSTTDDDDIIYQPCSHQDELDLANTFIGDLFDWIEKNTFVPY